MRVAPVGALDVLALAAQEEADEVRDIIDADPLGFKWGVPLPR